MALPTLSPAAKVDDADFRRTLRGIQVPVGTTAADVMRPGFWVHHYDKIAVGDLLEITSADFELDCEARVIRKKDGLIGLRLLRLRDAEKVEAPVADEAPVELPALPDNYLVNHAPKTGWRVWSKVPSRELVRDIKSKPDAYNWAINHARLAEEIAA